MFEICALLAPKKSIKARAPRKPSGPKIAAGVSVTVHGHTLTVVGRDARYANAWFLTDGSREVSMSRDMLTVIG